MAHHSMFRSSPGSMIDRDGRVFLRKQEYWNEMHSATHFPCISRHVLRSCIHNKQTNLPAPKAFSYDCHYHNQTDPVQWAGYVLHCNCENIHGPGKNTFA